MGVINMKFISVSDLRLRSGEVWRKLQEEKEAIITSNRKPIAILVGIEGEDAIEYLANIRRAQAMMAVNKLQEYARATGKDRIKGVEIEEEIQAERKNRAS